jgi:23S rRNA-/tRNA-specific pseudouridylate synthase
MGSPIVGDILYGSQEKNEAEGRLLPGVGLFSASIAWSSDDGKLWRFESKAPWER